MSDHYHLAVIGSGSGGREATLLAARKGLRTALIERDKLGGICFHRGCYAVLGLQACARQLRDSWKSVRFGNRIELLHAALSDWMTAQSNVSSRLIDQFKSELQQLNVDVHHGQGEFLDNRTLQVIGPHGTKKIITADNIIVATGSSAGFYASSMRRVVNSDELLRITKLPEHLAIVGAGHIGCEFASIYRTLGCEVTLIEKEDRVLPRWEIEAGERVAEALTERQVKILLNQPVSFAEIKETKEGVRIPGPGDQGTEANLVLVAIGRTPNSQGLGLDALGIDDRHFLKVDESMRLTNAGVYAIGDVNGISMLDSTAFSQANVAINTIQGHPARFDQRWIPRCIHTEPPVASVGWSEQEAASAGLEFFAASDAIRLISDSERSLIDPEPTFIKIIIDSASRHFLGSLVVGDHAPILANIVAMAMQSGLTIDRLREMPLAQPSASEALMATLRKLG